MTHEELDRLWFQAMEESIKDGEMVARYHFAKLIYEATFRDANIAASRTIIDAAVLHEREACAKVCEEMRPSKPEFDQRYYDGCTDSAAAIRARSNT